MDVLEPKYYAAIGMVMTLIAVIFLFLMGSALVLPRASGRDIRLN